MSHKSRPYSACGCQGVCSKRDTSGFEVFQKYWAKWRQGSQGYPNAHTTRLGLTCVVKMLEVAFSNIHMFYCSFNRGVGGDLRVLLSQGCLYFFALNSRSCVPPFSAT
eukprot:4863795-Amphidinium_carterae.1